MSNTKKVWNASKAKKRTTDANKKAIKINATEAREHQKKAAKEKYK